VVYLVAEATHYIGRDGGDRVRIVFCHARVPSFFPRPVRIQAWAVWDSLTLC